jgi:hypothetical protein
VAVQVNVLIYNILLASCIFFHVCAGLFGEHAIWTTFCRENLPKKKRNT